MHAGIGHIFAPKELSERTSIAPKRHFVVFNAIESQCFQDAFLRVVAIDIALTNDASQRICGINGPLVHVGFDGLPVAIVNEFGQINLAHHGRHHVTILQMEVVIGTIKIGGHHGNIVGSVLQIVALAHL